jgi:hypothetical protein
MVLEKTCTFQGPDPKSPRLVLVGVETKVVLEPAESSGITAQIRKQEGKGNLVFDTDAGRIISARGTQKIEMLITVRDQRIEQATEATTSMTLAR